MSVEHVAENEDGVMWVRRTCTRREARREVAGLVMESAWRWRVVAEHMRPATVADCDAKVHRDEDEDSEDCRCWTVEEGWHYACKADHPDAIAVWRVEAREMPSWWIDGRRKLRPLHPRHRRRPAPLWGHRVQRRTWWLDRVLLGEWVRVLAGDSGWHIGQEQVRHCGRCRMETLHTVPMFSGAPWCTAHSHYDHPVEVVRV